MSDHPSITVSEFLAHAPPRLELSVLAGAAGASERRLSNPRIQKLGLGLAGFTNYIHPGRIQIVGQSEIWYLGQLEPQRRRDAIRNLTLQTISCVLVTKGLEPPVELIAAADEAALPLLRTPLLSSVAINIATEYLQEMLAPLAVRHGVLLDLYGLGVLLEGASGIGKSECALDLVARGHRLVSDDVVEIRRTGPDRLIGSAPELLHAHLEIRGLGIINIRDLFGVSAISAAKTIDLSIRLERWDDALEVDRLGIDAQVLDILGVGVPQVLIPVSPGRNLSTLVETAVRVQLLRMRGYNAARSFVERHAQLIEAAGDGAAGGGAEAKGAGARQAGQGAGGATDSRTAGDGE
ncbi:MAG TPA: HPr(Ser) kinase/phosphatase [Pyrinomonadaceae bacterium]|jgi:HPr kinase/phosphorylase|nr:HPr(Ser) kinase/phosphatase [Pyrinomonadaceae bacterium]